MRLKILLPTDFSLEAKKAADFICTILQGNSADIYLLNAYQAPHMGSGMLISLDSILEKDSMSELKKLERQLRSKWANEDYDFHLISDEGYLDNTVEKFSDQYGIDLIAMGTKGESGFSGALFGSNASKVIAQSKIPVLTIPETTQLSQLKKICLASDGKLFQNAEVVNQMRALRKILNVEMEIINVVTSKNRDNLKEVNENLAQLAELLSIDEGKIVQKEGETFMEVVDQCIAQSGAEMLLMVPRKHSFVEKFMNISESKSVAHSIKIPLWTFHDAF